MEKHILPKEIVKGYYYHYKHNPEKGFNDYSYEVVGIGRNTEEGGDKEYKVLYRPLYSNDWMEPADYQSRPYSMFIEDVVHNGETVPRFRLITDTQVIEKLKEIKEKMYN